MTLQALKASKNERIKKLGPFVAPGAYRGRSSKELHDPAAHEMRLRDVDVDVFGRTIGRYDHYWRGLRIVGGETIGILDSLDEVESVQYAFGEMLEPPEDLATPKIAREAALQTAILALGSQASGAQLGGYERVIEPQILETQTGEATVWSGKGSVADPTRMVRSLHGFQSVHRFHFLLRDGSSSVHVETDTGKVLSVGPNRSCSAATLMANTYYYTAQGTQVPFLGEQTGGAYWLGRGNLYSIHAGRPGYPIYSSASPVFGDGNPFVMGNPGDGANGQTQAADVMIGTNTAFDFYWTVLGRYHFDGDGRNYATISVHNESISVPASTIVYSLNSEYYFIDFPSKFDLSDVPAKGATELSIAAHEWSHLVNFRSARVGRDNNSPMDARAVNEGFANILSTACRFWDSTGRGGTIGTPSSARWRYDWSYQPQYYGATPATPYSGERWTYGSQILFRPSNTNTLNLGRNPCWWTGIYTNSPHRESMPLQWAYYFLANGADPLVYPDNPNDSYRGRTSPFTPAGFTGIGVHKATQVYYYALTQTMYFNSGMSTVGGYIITAAQTLFGGSSPEAVATAAALTAANLANPYPYTVPVSSALTSVSTAPLVPSKQNKARLATSLPAGTVQHNFKITLPPRTTLRLLIDDGSIAGNPDGSEPIIDNTIYPGLEIRDVSGATLLASALPELASFQGSLFARNQPSVAPGTVYRIKASCEYKNPNDMPLLLVVRVMSPNSRTTACSYVLDGLLRWVAKAEVLGQESQW